SYARALADAEKSATATSALAAVAAITREHAGLKNASLAAEFPADLPKSLQTPRRTFLEASGRLRANELARRRAIDADYLRALAGLASRAPANSPLAQQIAAEKAKLLASVVPTGAPANVPRKSDSRNALVNGGFEQADADGHPLGWTLPDRPEASFKLMRDGKNGMLHAEMRGTLKPAFLSQEIAIPPRAKSVTISSRTRGKWEERDANDGFWGASAVGEFLDGAGKKIGDLIISGGRDAAWKSERKTKEIPDGAKTFRFQCGFKHVNGAFDFDEVRVEFD
ncbi:MAG TPA: hypothetical protein VFV83_09855, partial [Chthoniobacteraceae bacterium]|nr:hypothetical protein [Chthoniobacteraceae bacterium]